MRAVLLGSMALLASMTRAEEPEDWVAPKDNLAVGMRRAMEAERARAEGRRTGPHTYGNPCVLPADPTTAISSTAPHVINQMRVPCRRDDEYFEGRAYERFELTAAGRSSQREDPRLRYWMHSRLKLVEVTGVSQPEAQLSRVNVKDLLESEDATTAVAAGELSLAGRLPYLKSHEALQIISTQLQNTSSGLRTAWVGVCSRWSISYKSEAMSDLTASPHGYCEPLNRLREMQSSGQPIHRHGVPSEV